MNGAIALKKAKTYTDEIADSLGSLKGAPCTIKSTTETDDGVIIVFEWTGTSGATQTSSILVKNGEDGQAQTITTARTVDDDGVTITVVNTDGSIASTATIYDGDSGEVTSIDWSKIENRPFVTLSTDDFEVDENGVLSVVANGEGNKINSISVNGENVEIDENKNVDITIPEVPIKTISQDGTALAIDENGNVDIPIADTNKIEVVKVNGVTLEISDTDKSVDITVPDEYDDTALSDRVTETENAIATLNGTGEGSVSKSVDDALNKFATDLSDDGIVNTYKELVDYAASHSSDVAEMVADIAENTTAIEELNTKIADIETSVENTYNKDETYSRTEIDDAITNAQLGGEEVDLTEYIKEVDADEKYVLDEEIETITAEQIEELIGLSADEITNLASLLSDQTIELSKTWSSSCIYGKLNETLDSAKAYTLQELSKAIGASYKVVTSVDQMTDSKVLYLLKDTDSGMYNIYVYDADTSTAELIGSFEINLDDYYTKRESEDLFATKADVVANYATKQEVVDGYATKEELSAIQDSLEFETENIDFTTEY